jgi:urate oxidase
MSWALVENSYGKSRVRLTKVTRHSDHHDLCEVAVDIQLQGEFDLSYTAGDNSQVVPTDTMKNTVYALAASHPLSDIESFGKALGRHFLDNFAHVSAVSVTLTEELWTRIQTNGEAHRHSFVGGNREKRVAHVDCTRGDTTIESGIEDLVVLKTTDSEFVGYIKDKYTTLPETRDRIFATAVVAHWIYKTADADFNGTYKKLRQLFLDIFCKHHSLAVQQTLYEMGKAALDACPDIEEIRIEMPNQHRIPIDLTRLGLENKNEIFVPTDEPFGLISATIARSEAHQSRGKLAKSMTV